MNHAIKSLVLVATLLICASSSSGAQFDQRVAISNHASASLDGSLLSSVTPLTFVRHGAEDPSPAMDGVLALVLGGSLIALQLRRRQKSLRNPRLLTG